MICLIAYDFHTKFYYGSFSIIPIAAPPKVTNVRIIGDLRENSKVTVTGTVSGGTEGSSRVQWFKTNSSTLDGERNLEAVSSSKVAKVTFVSLQDFDILLGHVCKY